MKKTMLIMLGLMAIAPSAMAVGVLDWLKPAVVETGAGGKKAVLADAAELLTLEPGETEMYPKPSPDGRFLLVRSAKGKHTWISRRYAENGDPANRVTDDIRANDSIAWKDAGHVYFLSGRAGGLGLWKKISDGEGMLSRLLELRGILTQPLLLSDGTIIAVRLTPAANQPADRRSRSDGFNNWNIPGFHTSIVRIHADGNAQVLSEGINLSLSPNGKWIAFSMPVGRSMHLFRMHPDGSELVQITSARSVDVQSAWSADGKWIVFTSNRAHVNMRNARKSNWDIWAINPDGRNLMQLTRGKARDGAPRVASDGRVYFHSDRPVSRQLREQRQVKNVPRGFHIWSIAFPDIRISK
ncbi:MAG: TolB protein [Mariprofundaceae bacterium]|nr:TolB protein [Mariprofundaceae bacterium]